MTACKTSILNPSSQFPSRVQNPVEDSTNTKAFVTALFGIKNVYINYTHQTEKEKTSNSASNPTLWSIKQKKKINLLQLRSNSNPLILKIITLAPNLHPGRPFTQGLSPSKAKNGSLTHLLSLYIANVSKTYMSYTNKSLGRPKRVLETAHIHRSAYKKKEKKR